MLPGAIVNPVNDRYEPVAVAVNFDTMPCPMLYLADEHYILVVAE